MDPEYASLFQPPAQQRPTPQQAIQCMTRANGNMYLAAEYLTRMCNLPLDAKLTPEEVGALAAEDMPLLKKSIQASLAVNLYSMLDSVVQAAQTSIMHLEPGEAIRALHQLGGMLAQLTDDKHSTLDVNVDEYVYQHLDPDIKHIMVQIEAARALQAPSPNVIEHSAEGDD